MTFPEDVGALLGMADHSLAAARFNLENGFPDVGMNRAYYAMFYAASAALVSIGVTPKTHAGVRSMLAQHFIQTGRLTADRLRDLSRAFDERLECDYLGLGIPDPADVRPHLDNAAIFIAEVRRVLGPGNPSNP